MQERSRLLGGAISFAGHGGLYSGYTFGGFVFAVIGTWAVDGALDSDQLAHIADTVRQQPGFVHGYWGQESRDLTLAHAVVILEDEAQAQTMAEGVTAAISSAQLRVVRVLAAA